MSEVIVTDASIVVSSLISDNRKIRRILAKKDLEFVAPKFAVVELFKHAPKIQKATKLSEDHVLDLFSSIVNRIKFYEEDLISLGNWTEAFRLCRGVDEKDTPYVALTLEIGGKLWTKDEELKRGLSKKGFDKFYTP